MKRTFLVTAKFKLTGNIGSIVVPEHIKSKLEDKLKETAIELWGEYYGDIDEEWEMYVGEGGVSVKVKEEKEETKEKPVQEKRVEHRESRNGRKWIYE